MRKKEFILYGLDRYREIIDIIIKDLNIVSESFDILLILTEALTNAFKHGNNSDNEKPIHLRYNYDDNSIKFEVEDCGKGFKNITIQDDVLDESLLNDCGRGLFIMKSVADKIEFKDSTLIIQKYLNAG